MQTTQQDFAEAYRVLPDEEIAALYADFASLTGEARSALTNEIHQRGLDDPQLQKLHAAELRHENQFDRLEKYRRKKLAWGDLPTTAREWILAIVGGIALILILELILRHH
jgi:hypothetical protein